jgi:hypothetical protein
MANAGQRESSFLFSLNELARMEEERVAREAADERARRDAALRAREEAEARARAEREAEERAREEARELAALRAREEAARFEAGKVAAAEEARARVAEGARAAELERRRAHAVELARVSGAEDLGKLRRRVAALAIGFGVTVAGMTTVYVAALAPRAEARAERLLEDESKLEGTVRELSAKVSAGEAREDALRRDLEGERATRDALQRELDRLKAERVPKGHAGGPVAAPAPTTHVAPPSTSCKNPLDPMCGDLH